MLAVKTRLVARAGTSWEGENCHFCVAPGGNGGAARRLSRKAAAMAALIFRMTPYGYRRKYLQSRLRYLWP